MTASQPVSDIRRDTDECRDDLEGAHLQRFRIRCALELVTKLFKLRDFTIQFLHSTSVELASACIASLLQAIDVVFQD